MDNIKSTIKEVMRLLSYLVDDSAETYGEWLNQWYMLYKKERLKERSSASLAEYIEKRIIPLLGNVRLNELSGMQLQ